MQKTETTDKDLPLYKALLRHELLNDVRTHLEKTTGNTLSDEDVIIFALQYYISFGKEKSKINTSSHDITKN